MIQVDRTSVSKPEVLLQEGPAALDRLREFFSGGKRARSQRRAPFEAGIYQHSEVTAALGELFRGKCAFCESSLSEKDLQLVEHFRPLARAADLKGTVSIEHYWWLAYSWPNLYSICLDCRRYKKTRFPVQARRAVAETFGEDLAKELPLLLDPCADQPDTHLSFDPDGSMAGLDERGRITIDVFGLNRDKLIEARRHHLAELDAFLDDRMTASEPLEPSALYEAFEGDRRPFSAWTRAHIRRRTEPMATMAEPPPGKQPPAPRKKGHLRAYVGGVWLQKIELENFKAIQRMTLEFPEPAEQIELLDDYSQSIAFDPDRQRIREPWIVLLGENGVGKSSVLKAVALALASPAKRRRLVPDAGSLVRRQSRSPWGSVRLTFNAGVEAFELRFHKKRADFELDGDIPLLKLLAYGSTRLLPPESEAPRSAVPRFRIENLFNPRSHLSNAESWLADPKLVNPDQFNLLSTSLKKLLSLEGDVSLRRRRGRLYASLYGDAIPIRELSDGYQSVLALTTDIMMNLSGRTFDMEAVEGTVLVDEIEVHLHPRWKMQIVESFRQMFPSIRFVATTHDPLCLQGLGPGEVHVMARHPETDQVYYDQVDVPPGIRADQLLTGEWFGLGTTRDRDTLQKMQQHSQLLIKADKSAADRDRMAELHRVLRRRLGDFGSSPVEQMAAQAAAEVEPNLDLRISPEKRKAIQAKIQQRLRQKLAQRGGS